MALRANEGTFSGVLVESDATMWVFDDCATVATKPNETVAAIAGRVWVERSHVVYLQEVNTLDT